MNTLESFKSYIKTLSDDALSTYGAEIEQKMYRARNPQMVLGYAMGIEEITLEINLRKYPISKEVESLSDEELLNELENLEQTFR